MTDLKTLIPLPRKITRKPGEFRMPRRIKLSAPALSPGVLGLVRRLGDSVETTAGPSGANLTIALDRRVPALASVRKELREQGYVLNVGKSSLSISALSERGVFYALQTLLQMIQGSPGKLRCVKIVDWPDMPFRGVHATWGSNQPSFKSFKKLIDRLSGMKMNRFIIEYDNKFPWESHPIFASETSFSKKQLTELIEYARRRFVDLVPCLDSMGHAQCYLCHKKYAHLSEIKGNINDLCGSDPRARKLIRDLWTEILDVHRDTEYAHITGDEVFWSGDLQRSRPRGYVGPNAIARLYTDYYTELIQWLHKRNTIPILWGDMLIKHPDDLKRFPRDVVICDWNYHTKDQPYEENAPWLTDRNGKIPAARRRLFEKYWGNNGTGNRFTQFPYTKFFKDQGFLGVIGSTVTSEERSFQLLPSFHRRFCNNKRFPMAIKKNRELGILVTYWSGLGPVERGLFGVTAGADFGWHVRDEKESVFTKRFGQRMLDMKPKETGSIIRIEDGLYKSSSRIIKFKKWMWDDEPCFPDISANLKDLIRRSPENRDYKQMLKWTSDFLALRNEIGAVFNAIDARVVGRGTDTCLDLKEYVNTGFVDCTPTEARELPMQGWEGKTCGVKMKVLHGHGRGKNTVITTRGKRNPGAPLAVKGIPVGRQCDRVFILLTGYDVAAGTHIADIVFNLADGRRERMPLKEGVNISDWGKGYVCLEKALTVWENNSRFARLAWWDNPDPTARVETMDIESTRGQGYPIICGITVRKSRRSDVVDNLNGYRGKLDRYESRIRKLFGELARVLTSIVITEHDAARAAKVVLDRSELIEWIGRYRSRL